MMLKLSICLLVAAVSCAVSRPVAAKDMTVAGLLQDHQSSDGVVVREISPPSENSGADCETGVTFTRGARYGDDALNVIDVATAQTSPDARRPIVVFVVGDKFTGISDATGHDPLLEKAMCFAASNGLVAFAASYRLAPAATWPSGTKDVASAISWVFENADLFGGNGQEIVAIGYGAGAFHLANLLAHKEFQETDDLIAGAVLVSGMYRAETDADESERAYFGPVTEGSLARWSALQGLTEIEEPIVLAWSSSDVPRIVAQGEELKKSLCDAGHCPRTAMLEKPSSAASIFNLDGASAALHERLRQLISQLEARGLP